MAKKYTASLQLRCWKLHECSTCGTEYAYVLNRKITGRGGSADRAQAMLKKNYANAQRDENDMQPCPACGHYQQDMIGVRLMRRRNWLLVASFIMPVLLPILCGTNAVQFQALTWVAVIYCAVALGVQFLVGLWKPNGRLEANRQLAAQRVNADVIQIRNLQNARNPALGTPTVPSQSPLHKAALALLLISIVLAAVPEILRTASGWPLNNECYPPVVGPIDSTRIYMDESISSVKGYWRGTPDVVLTGAAGQAVKVPATANQNDWGDSIYVKSEERSSSSHPWVDLTLPAASVIPKGPVECHIQLNVEFPQISVGDTFRVMNHSMSRDLTLRLAPAGAGGRYNAAWWIGTVLATVGVLIAGILLVMAASRYRRQAKATKVFPVEPPAPPAGPAAPPTAAVPPAAPPIQPA